MRIESPGAVYHITSRGNGRGEILLDDEDRRHFLELIGEVIIHHLHHLECARELPRRLPKD